LNSNLANLLSLDGAGKAEVLHLLFSINRKVHSALIVLKQDALNAQSGEAQADKKFGEHL
jgi:hypothetical protein